MDIRSFYHQLLTTQWRRFFKTNGERTWADIRFSGFQERACSLYIDAQWMGMTNTGELYYSIVTIDTCGEYRFMSKETKGNYGRFKMKTSRDFIETFLNPKCRCRVGFHWKCGVHGKWVN